MIPQLRAGTPSSVGSLPHTDAHVAASLALAAQPELPSAPQLPARHPYEGMLAQLAAGISGVSAGENGALLVDRRRLAPPASGSPLDREAWGGTIAFLRTAAASERTGPIKLQMTGPVTLGLALLAGGAKEGSAFAVAAATVASRIHALMDEASATLPASDVMLVLDEPGLTAYLSPSYPLSAEATIDLLSSSLATASTFATTGVHCCGRADWRVVLSAGPDVISLPVEHAADDDAPDLAAFLKRGGWIAWGAVPTDSPIGDRDDVHWRRLADRWRELARNGCDPARLRMQSIVTPACGLAHHRIEQVDSVYALVRRIGDRVHHEVLAAPMSAGA